MNICKKCGCENVKVTLNPSKTNYYCPDCGSRLKPIMSDDEIVKGAVRLEKQKQAAMDKNRIANKLVRGHIRVENAFEKYTEAIDLQLKKYGSQLNFAPKVTTPPIHTGKGLEVGFIQLTDHHLNELVNLPHNKYDISIASKRLKKLADEAIYLFSVRGIKRVVLEFGGDLLNSDRRLDELLSQATNRAKATIIAVELYMGFISHLRTHFELDIISVLGNESRANKEILFSNDVASNNYDYTIVAMVKKLVEASNIDNVRFGPIDQYETVVNINGCKVLMTHDITRMTDSQLKTQSLIGRYYLAGNPIDYVVSGHIHAEKGTAFASRGSSLVGSNSYNEVSLGLISRASQQIGYFGKDYRTMMSIDLQNVDGVEGYPVSVEHMAYNAKSDSKNDNKVTIFEVVI